MSSKKSTSSSGLRIVCTVATSLFFVATVVGCGTPRAAKPVPKPERVYVQFQALTDAHPLAVSLRELDAIAESLRRDSARTQTLPVTPLRLSNQSSLTNSSADARRNAEARKILQQNAQATLTRYVAALRSTGMRIRAEKRAELEGIARTRSAEREAQARAKIENEARLSIVSRSDAAREARIRRNAARLNLSNGNVVSIARDPVTKLPDEDTLKKQVAALDTLEKETSPAPPPPTVTSDEARLTKLLRDWEEVLAKIRAANDQDTVLNNGLIADAIATIRAEDAIWVEQELAKMPNRDQNIAQLRDLRGELGTLLRTLQATERAAQTGIGRSQTTTQSLPSIASVTTSSPVTTDVLRRLSVQRAAIRATIQRDVTAAVHDAGLAHNLDPVFSSSSNLPNRTDEFHQWIFGNVDAVSLSNKPEHQ